MKILLRILQFTVRHKWMMALSYLCLIGTTAFHLILPRLFGEAIDKVAAMLDGGVVSNTTILTISLLILGAGLARGLFAYGQTYLGEAMGQVTVYDIRNKFYDHVQHLSFAFHDKQHTGNLMSRAIVDMEAIRLFVNMALVRVPYYILIFISVSFVMIRMDLRLGLVSISFLPVVPILSIWTRTKQRAAWLRAQKKMAELNTVLQENFSGQKVVKAFASDDYEEKKFEIKSDSVAKEMVTTSWYQAANGTVLVLSYTTVVGLVLWYGGMRVIEGSLTPGQLAQALFYLQIMSMPVRQLGMVVSNFARAVSAGERLFDILDTESPVKGKPNAVVVPRSKGHVRFEDVDCSYGNGPQVLKKINIDAPPGRITALLGAPGSGKTSVVNLLPRFYDVNSGRISIDGQSIRDVTLKSLRRNIGVVQKDVFLFNTSMRENIAYGRGEATMEEVVNAARVAQLHEYIETLPKGYETVIGERGVSLSGGQRQRLSIARAVLLDPPVLILDDSTSSVDAHTEEQIRAAMEAVMHGRTTFVIAHRLSTVHRAHQLLVLKAGEIVERGTHQELIRLGGLYRDIYDLQLRPQEEKMREFDVPDAARKGRAKA
ncbi:MAG: ABC transporter ATP-binding protein [SAR202 cluster bacterium]|nr:ABC transporter ATP-binding protein [SAR202 cluster bacterium]